MVIYLFWAPTHVKKCCWNTPLVNGVSIKTNISGRGDYYLVHVVNFRFPMFLYHICNVYVLWPSLSVLRLYITMVVWLSRNIVLLKYTYYSFISMTIPKWFVNLWCKILTTLKDSFLCFQQRRIYKPKYVEFNSI